MGNKLNSLKSMMARYAQIKEKGFNEEDATNINQVTKALKEAEIVPVDQYGQLRNFGDVIDELMVKWDELGKRQDGENLKRYIATTIGGTYQLNRFLTLMENSNDAIKNYETALNSAGTANQKFAIYQDSAQSKLDKLTSTFEEFYSKSLNSNILKGAIGGLTLLVGALDNIGRVIVLITSLFITFNSKSIVDFIIGIGSSVKALFTLQTTAEGVTVALTATQRALGIFGLIISAVTLLTSAFDAYNTAQEENNRKTVEYLENANSQQQTIANLAKEYQNLSTNVDNDKDSKIKLTSVESQLKTALGESSKELDLQNGKLDSNIAKIKELTKTQIAQQLQLKQLEYENAKKYLTGGDNNGIFVNASNRGKTPEQIKSDAEKELNALNDLAKNGSGLYNDWARNTDIKLIKNLDDKIKQNQDIVKEYEALQKAYNNPFYISPENQKENTPPKQSTGLYSGGGSSDSTKTPIPYEDMSAELIKSYNYQVEEDKLDAEHLQKKIKLAAKQKDYNKELEYTNQLMSLQQKTITDIETANSKILQEQDKVKLRAKDKGLNTDEWYDPSGEMSLKYKQLLNSFSGATDKGSKLARKNIEDIFKSLYDLKKAWKDNENQIDSMNQSIDETQQKINSIIETSFDTSLKSITDSISSTIKSLQKEQEEAEDKLNKKIKEKESYYDNLITKKKDELDLLKEENEQQERQNKLLEIEQEMEDVLNDKRFEYIDASGNVTYSYDKSKYDELSKQRKDLVDQYKQEDLEKAIQDEVDALEKAKDEKINALKDEIETTKTNYQNRIEDYETFNTILQDLQNSELETLQSNISSKISELQKYSEAWEENASRVLAAQSLLSGDTPSTSNKTPSNSSSPNTITKTDVYQQVASTNDSDLNKARKKLLDKLFSGTHHNGIDDGVFMGGKSFDPKTEAIVKVLKNQEIPFTKPQLYQIIPNVATNLFKGIFNNQNQQPQIVKQYILNNAVIKANNPLDLFYGIEQLTLQNGG